MAIDTPRLRLRPWAEDDRDAFAAMNADAEVMADLGGSYDRARSDRKFDRYAASFRELGFGRWLVESRDGAFLGYAGIMRDGPDHPLGLHYEIGWRLVRSAWGFGFASEAASAALGDGFTRLGLSEILAYTAPDNIRSQHVMQRIGLRRDPARDFDKAYETLGMWRGLVWSAAALQWREG